MNQADMHRYRNWGHSVYHTETLRLMKTIRDTIEADERMKNKAAIHAIVATEFPKEVEDIVAFRDSYLSSRMGDEDDDNHYWVGVALNNALTKLYIEDFGDEIDVPSKEECEAMAKYVYNLRQTKEAAEAPVNVYVTPESLEEKSKELRTKPSDNSLVASSSSSVGQPKTEARGVEESKLPG
jgi:hypothetical protein